MKKTLLCAGALLLAAGLALSSVGLRMGGQDTATVHLFGRSWTVYAPTAGRGPMVSTTGRHYTEAYAYEEATPMPSFTAEDSSASHDSTPFSSIDIALDLGSVTIAAGDDYGVETEAWGRGYKVDHWYSDGTLFIESRDDGAFLPGADCGCNVTVHVPAGVWLESVDADLDMGDLTLAGLQMQYAGLYLDLGNLSGEALTVTNSLQAEVDLGEVKLSGDLGEAVDICADLGNVQLALSRPASEYCWELEADVGSITVDGTKQKADGSEASGGNGSRYLQVVADLGSITVDFGQDFAAQRAPVEAPPAQAQQPETTLVSEDGVCTETE